jgi:hypothetical protein
MPYLYGVRTVVPTLDSSGPFVSELQGPFALRHSLSWPHSHGTFSRSASVKYISDNQVTCEGKSVRSELFKECHAPSQLQQGITR